MFRIWKRQRETTEVLLSDKRVDASEADSVIPKGHSQATLNEVALRYRYDAKFRKELYNKGPVWTSQKGLYSSGDYEIREDGRQTAVTPDRYFKELKPKQRAYHIRGNGSVAIDYQGGREFLVVKANLGPYFAARVAYVKDDCGFKAAKEACRK